MVEFNLPAEDHAGLVAWMDGFGAEIEALGGFDKLMETLKKRSNFLLRLSTTSRGLNTRCFPGVRQPTCVPGRSRLIWAVSMPVQLASST